MLGSQLHVSYFVYRGTRSMTFVWSQLDLAFRVECPRS